MGSYEWKPFTLLVSAEEVEKEVLKIEAGKYYKTRDGRKVGPITFNGSNFGLLGESIYYSDGSISSSHPHQGDLISEWQDETPSPIRTVTRREIVAGVYGLIQIFDNGCMYIETDTYTADQCREAAHILNQIAEVLEENGK